MRLLVLAGLLIGIVPAQADDVCALLHKQTQAFSDAGQAGDGAKAARLLDDAVIFFNEAGDKATKADLSQAGAPAPGLNRTITTTDWACALHGDVAVTSFIDVVERGPSGKRDQFRYRSVETWLREEGFWKMIGSETLALADDPPAIALDSKTLDEYAGTYSAGAAMTIKLSRRNDDLFASLNGGPESVQRIQVRDIIFTPGRGSTPKVFQRNTNGHITGFVYLRGKQSLMFKRVA